MAEYKNWDRQYRFKAGPAGGAGFEIGEVTKECPVPLHIDFSCQKADSESQNTAKISIWNLNDAHLAVLNEKDCVCVLNAGYRGHMPLIFTGIISNVVTSRDNADIKTEIEVIDSLLPIRDTYVSITYEGTVNWKTILDDTASQMGITISYGYNATFPDISNGFSYVGMARNILSKGCDCSGNTWDIQDGILQVKREDDVMVREVYLLSKDTGLIGIPAKVVIEHDTAIDENTIGWDVEYFLNGSIGVDDYVRLESKYVQRYFRVESVEHNGDNVSGDWVSQARLLEIK